MTNEDLKQFHKHIEELSQDWDWTMQNPSEHPPATEAERATAREVIKEVASVMHEAVPSGRTHWIYKHGDVFYFNASEELPDCDSFSKALRLLQDKYDPTGLGGDHVKLCDRNGNTKEFPLHSNPIQAASAHTWHHIGDLARRATAIQQRYQTPEDPQAERALLMKKHGLTWEQARKRWPLADYAKWKD